MNLRSSEAVKPKSLVDAKAHFAAHSEWSRNPSSEKNQEKFSNDIASETNQEIAKYTDEPTKEVPQGVKGLFERKPTSQDVFSPAPGSYTVQIASYATPDESNAKIIDLRRSNFNEAYVQPVKLKNGEVWYRVSVGSFPSPSWAKKTGEKLVRQKLASDFVIRQVAQE
jgi:septal ring-binding cell division protein DamX